LPRRSVYLTGFNKTDYKLNLKILKRFKRRLYTRSRGGNGRVNTVGFVPSLICPGDNAITRPRSYVYAP